MQNGYKPDMRNQDIEPTQIFVKQQSQKQEDNNKDPDVWDPPSPKLDHRPKAYKSNSHNPTS